MKYHLKDDGEPALCKALPGNCSKKENGATVPHFESKEDARHYFESSNGSSHIHKVLSHGVMVKPGAIGVSAFYRRVSEKSSARNFTGTLDELLEIVRENFDNNEPGSGSVDGDVLLVRLPTKGFTTNIVRITDENANEIKQIWEARDEGEAPRQVQLVESKERFPAKSVKAVLYRADTLERDSGRSTEDEWEMVAVLSEPEENVPMHPTTMLRNYRNEKGGTYREYSSEEWARAYEFWSQHVKYVDPSED